MDPSPTAVNERLDLLMAAVKEAVTRFSPVEYVENRFVAMIRPRPNPLSPGVLQRPLGC